MVTKLNAGNNFNQVSVANVVKLLFAWIANVILRMFSLIGLSTLWRWFKIAHVSLFGVLILIVGAIFSQVNAQSTTVPEITIEANPYRFQQDTGNNYILVADVAPTAILTVSYQTVPASSSTPLTTTFPSGVVEHRIYIPDSANHTEVKIVEGTGYTLGNPSSALKIDPVITERRTADGLTNTFTGVQLKFRAESVEEGGKVKVVFRNTPGRSSTLYSFQYKIGDGNWLSPNDVFGDMPATPSMPTSTHLFPEMNFYPEFNNVTGVEYDEAELTILDNEVEGNQIISMRVEPNPNAFVSPNMLNETSIVVIDNDGPPTITIESTAEKVAKGGSFPVKISSSRSLSSSESFNINFSQNDFNSGYFSSFVTNSPITLDSNNQSRDIMVNSSSSGSGDGAIQISLDSGTGYTIDSEKRSVLVRVVDSQATRPQISIDNNSTNLITEGSSARFNVTSNVPAPKGGIKVRFSVDQLRDFLVSPDSQIATIPESMTRAQINLNGRADDSDFTGDGSITITILEDSDPVTYVPNTTNNGHIARITIKDANRTAGEVYLKAVSSTNITEGQSIEIQIGIGDVQDTAERVYFSVTELSPSNYLEAAPPTYLDIPAGLLSNTLTIQTHEDSIYDPVVNAKFELSTGLPEIDYTVSSNDNSAMFTITDNEDPPMGLSIISFGTSVSEGAGELNFQLVTDDSSNSFTATVMVSQAQGNSYLNTQDLDSSCRLDSGNIICSVVFQQNDTYKNFKVNLSNDSIDGSDGMITATITGAVGTDNMPVDIIAPNNKTAEVTVTDDDAPPVMKLEAPSNVTNNSFTETGVNEELRFIAKIKLDSSKGITTTASASVITLRYSVWQQVGNFLLAGEIGVNRTQDIVAFGNEVTLLLNVRGNNMDERDGRFTISLEPDIASINPKTYTVSEVAEEKSITIDVKDDEVPLISVQAPNVREGDGIIATVKSDIQPWRDLTVYLCIRDAESSSMCPDSVPNEDGRGDVLAMDLPDSIILPSDGSSVNPGIPLNIETTDDDVIEPGLGQVEIFAYVKNAETDGYRIDEGGTNSGTTVIVQDRDPEISIEAVGGSSVNEGDPAKFRITSNNTVEDGSTLTVYIDITQKGEFLDVTTMPTETDDDPPIPIVVTPNTMPPQATLSVTIATGNNSAEFSIKTNTDTTARPSGIITATIAIPANPAPYYRDTNYSTSIFVNDAQNELPEISIEAVSAADGQTVPVRENSAVRFRLTSNKAITQTFDVNLCISDGDTHSTNEGCSNTLRGGIVREYLTDTILQSVSMLPSLTNRSVEFEVELDDDEMIEDPGQIAVTVLPSTSSPSNYLVHAQNWAIVQVDSNDPTLSIAYSGTSNAISEDQTAIFTITSNDAYTTRDLTVFLEVTQSGQFLDRGQSRFPSVTINSGETTVMVPIEFENDDVEEPFGSVEVTLLPDRGNLYFIDETAKSAFVFVRDDDDGLQLPTVSISGRTDSIVEGEYAVFTVSTTPRLPVGTTLPVQLMIEVDGTNYISGTPSVGPDTVTVFSSISNSAGELVIKTRRIPDEESIGSIIVTIQPDPENYEVSIPNFDNITVFKSGGTDDNAVSILSTTTNISEGSDAEFEVKSARDATTDLIVNLNVSDPNNFITWRIPRSVTITSGERIAEFKVSTGMQNDQDGSFEVTVADGNGYVPIGPMSAEVMVLAEANDDSDSRISVAEVAVNSILDFLNVNSGSSPSTKENFQSDPSNNLPQISIIATSRQVDEGQPARFVVTSRHAVGEGIRISVSISGTAGTIANDSMRSIIMNTQQREVGFEIPTIDDDRAEKDGYVTATLVQSPRFSINGDAVAVVTISDATDRERRRNQLETANNEVLPNLHNALGVANWSNVSNQIGFALAGKTQPSLVLGGQSTMNQILTSNAQSFDNESWSIRSFLGNSSFSFNLTPGGQGTNLGTVWGLGEQQSLSQDNDGTNPWTAEIFTAQFGSDVRINDHGLFGLSVAASDSDIEFGSNETISIQYGIQNNNLQSYFGWQTPNQKSQVQLSTGVSFGEIELNQNDYDPMYLQSTNYSTAMKGNTLLYSSPNLANQMSTQVAINGDAYLSQLNISESTKFLNDLSTTSSWIQMGLEMANQYDFNPRHSIQLMNSISGITKGIDDELDLGLVSQSNLTFSDQHGFSISGTGQLMIYREQEPFDNFGFKTQIEFDQGRDGQGVLFSMIPSWNFTELNLENQLFTQQIANQNISELFNSDESTTLNSEIGYGITTASGWMTLNPYTGIELSNKENQNFQIGNRISLGTGVSFLIENAFKLREDDSSANEFKISGQLRW